MIYRYGRKYIPALLSIVTSIVTITTALSSLRYIAEICSKKDERTRRFHANPVGAKNSGYHERNSRSLEYNVSVIKRYPTDSLARFDVDGKSQNQEVSEGNIGISLRLSKVRPLFCISHKVLVYILCLYLSDWQVFPLSRCIILSENRFSLRIFHNKGDEKQNKIFLIPTSFIFYIIIFLLCYTEYCEYFMFLDINRQFKINVANYN